MSLLPHPTFLSATFTVSVDSHIVIARVLKMACKIKCTTSLLRDKKKLTDDVEKDKKKKRAHLLTLGSLEIHYRQLLKTNIWC
jgi:hypothetical protein